MAFDPEVHHRRSIRLRGYDYAAAGAYFVTICVQGRDALFGEIVDGSMRLNDAGAMVVAWWTKLPTKFHGIDIADFIAMPNHFHGIVTHVGAAPWGRPVLQAPDSRPNPGHPHGGAPTVGDVMDWFKTMTTNAYIRGVKEQNWPPFPGRLWQRNYFERVIRDENELSAVREYIRKNPTQWAADTQNPAIIP